MDNTQEVVHKVVGAIKQGKVGIIVLQANPTVDAVAAATGLYLGLIKSGSNVTIACSNPPNHPLAGVDKIQSALVSGGDNLVISFPYSEGSIDKVDYNIQGNFFNLVIVPRPGYPKLNPDDVSYTYSGGKADYLITIDVPNLNTIGQIYTDNQQEFQGKNIINIDRHLINNSYGTVNYVGKKSSSTSELVLSILQSMKVEIDKDIATNLYNGLLSATNNFTSYSVNPATFETASELLRLGAQKKAIATQQQQGQGFGGPSPFAPPPMGGLGGFGGGGFNQPRMPQMPGGPPLYGQPQNDRSRDFGPPPAPQPPSFPQNQYGQQGQQAPGQYGQQRQGQYNQNQQYQGRPPEKPIEVVEQDPQRDQPRPSDWLKSKVFKGKK